MHNIKTRRVDWNVAIFAFLLISIGILIPAGANTLSDGTYTINLTDTPEWITPTDYGRPQNSQAVKTRYLLIDQQYRHDSEGKLERYSRLITQPLTPTGLAEESTIEIVYKSLYEEIEIHHISIERNGVIIDKLEDVIANFLQPEADAEAAVYTGATQLNLILSNTRVNDIIDLAYTIKGQNPVFNSRFFDTRSIAWGVDVDNLHFRYNLDSEKDYTYKIHNSEETFLTSGSNNNQQVLDLLLFDIEAIQFEEGIPPWQNINPYISISEFSSWYEVAQWANNLFILEENDSSVIELSEELISAYPDPEEYILAALDFVQTNIRYISLSMGENSHRPHQPSEVLLQGFGDCKDKSLLFVALLRANGIEANPALVSTLYMGAIENELPNPGIFDHVITQVKYDDHYYWFDPTRNYQSGTLKNRVVSDYKKALLVSSETESLIDIQLNNQYSSSIHVEEELRSEDFSNEVTYIIKSKFSGEMADLYRSYFANTSRSTIQNDFITYHSNFYGDMSSSARIISIDDKDSNEFSFTEEYIIEDFWKREGPFVIGDIYHNPVRNNISYPEVIQRRNEYYPGSKVKILHTLDFYIPEETEVEIEDTTRLSSNNFLNYKSFTSYTPGHYQMNINYELNTDHIAVEDLREYRDAIKIIDEDTYYQLTFLVPQSISASKDTKSLINRLQELVLEL